MTSKEQAISEIVAIANTHKITIEELTSALGREEIEANKKDVFTLTRAFSYLGGIFILAGLSTYVHLVWDHLNSFSRILITLGPGIICLILAAVMAQKNSQDRKITVLVILSALFQTSGLFVAVYELATGGGDIRIATVLIFSVLALQYGTLFSKLKLTSFLFFTIYFATSAFAILCNLIHIPDDLVECICGVSLLALSYGIQRTPYNSICGFGYFVSSILLLWVGFDLIKDTRIEMLYLGIAAFMLYVSTIVHSRSILVTSTLAIFAYISYYTDKYFADSIGWPVCLILLGFILFGLSTLAIKINKRLAD